MTEGPVVPRITVTSVSGGQSSAYLAANYPSDHLLFSLVCINEPKAQPKDKKLVQLVSDRIGREFIATAEDDTILHTMLDLEQFLGQRIHWVAGESFDDLIESRQGWLPNKKHRYCTVELKLRPMFRWWRENIGEPIQTNIGFRANEGARAQRLLERCNDRGFLEFKDVVGKLKDGRNKWGTFDWQRPVFPLIADGIHRDQVVEFWKGKPVRFAKHNNCVGCFHRNPIMLRMMWEDHPEKLQWYANQEDKGTWRSDLSYDDIRRHRLQVELDFDDFAECDSGQCGI